MILIRCKAWARCKPILHFTDCQVEAKTLQQVHPLSLPELNFTRNKRRNVQEVSVPVRLSSKNVFFYFCADGRRADGAHPQVVGAQAARSDVGGAARVAVGAEPPRAEEGAVGQCVESSQVDPSVRSLSV